MQKSRQKLYKPERRTFDPMRLVQTARGLDIGLVLVSQEQGAFHRNGIMKECAGSISLERWVFKGSGWLSKDWADFQVI